MTRLLKSRFPSGLIQFTLFNLKGEPLSERLVCLQNADQLRVDIQSEKHVYTPREMVSLNLTTHTADDKATIGNFSIAVIDETKVYRYKVE